MSNAEKKVKSLTDELEEIHQTIHQKMKGAKIFGKSLEPALPHIDIALVFIYKIVQKLEKLEQSVKYFKDIEQDNLNLQAEFENIKGEFEEIKRKIGTSSEKN